MGEATGSTDWNAWNDGIIDANRAVITQFRANGGRVGGYFAGAAMLLVHHLGARTGRERITPLVYVPVGRDMVVAATKGGAPSNPDWYYNLKAHPRVLVEVGTDRVVVTAAEIRGHDRDDFYARLAHLRPAFAGYATRTTRVIPMFRLSPLDS